MVNSPDSVNRLVVPLTETGRPLTKTRARYRLSLSWLMALVLIFGVLCGLVVRTYDRDRRRNRLLQEATRQENVTFQILNLNDPQVRRLIPVLPLNWGGGASRSGS